MKPKYVIFDCDGVLVDSEIIANRVEAEYKTELGFPISTQDHIAKFTGLATNHPLVKEELSRLPDDYLDVVDKRIQRVYEQELSAISGIHETLNQLHFPKCVASNSDLESIVRKLAFTRLLPHFPKSIFSSQMVRQGKPAPDLFLYAAKTLQWQPQDCIVIEDSVAGVQAALAAGMRVLGFTGGQHIQLGHSDTLKGLGSTKVFSDMRELPEILRHL
ncbi:hypothetical protein AZI86_09910 [Bdellovibrio bacteriovorus]|uniref:Phosphatase n=1 Tax=Bdellovibrio bacteriovorus TaxID=959 RepID=A0A150WS69_BDEBC|nr:HAD family hydrolase [Bdellovibrio bacteriovorus]KYG67302.1 hypothetical protein AZI86_09910 [Bdellovibrio bacteriovorus]